MKNTNRIEIYLEELISGKITPEDIKESQDNLSFDDQKEILEKYEFHLSLEKSLNHVIDEGDDIEVQGDIYTYGTDAADNKFSPIERQQFIVLAGRGGSGKTQYSYWMARKNAQLGRICLYISLEMSTKDLLTKICRDKAKISIAQWRNKSLITKSQKDIYYAEKARLDNEENVILVGWPEGVTCTTELILEKIEEFSPDLVFIDNLGLIKAQGSEEDQQIHITQEFLNYSKNKRVPIILIHHLNKSGTLRGTEKIRDNVWSLFMVEREQDDLEVSDEEKAKFSMFQAKSRYNGNGALHHFYYDTENFHDNYWDSQPGFGSNYEKIDEPINF